jgi:hypothetical protein
MAGLRPEVGEASPAIEVITTVHQGACVAETTFLIRNVATTGDVLKIEFFFTNSEPSRDQGAL